MLMAIFEVVKGPRLLVPHYQSLNDVHLPKQLLSKNLIADDLYPKLARVELAKGLKI
jgi:hypothetical protein